MLGVRRVDANVQRLVERSDFGPAAAAVRRLEQAAFVRLVRRGAPIQRGAVTRVFQNPSRGAARARF